MSVVHDDELKIIVNFCCVAQAKQLLMRSSTSLAPWNQIFVGQKCTNHKFQTRFCPLLFSRMINTFLKSARVVQQTFQAPSGPWRHCLRCKNARSFHIYENSKPQSTFMDHFPQETDIILDYCQDETSPSTSGLYLFACTKALCFQNILLFICGCKATQIHKFLLQKSFTLFLPLYPVKLCIFHACQRNYF